MQQEHCCVCLKTRPDDSQWKDIFDERNRISLYQKDESKNAIEPDRNGFTLYEALEFIAGSKITNKEKQEQPLLVCAECMENVENYVNFRAQIRTNFFGISKNDSVNVKDELSLAELSSGVSPIVSQTEELLVDLQERDALTNTYESSGVRELYEDNMPSDNSMHEKEQGDQENNEFSVSDESNNSSNISLHKNPPKIEETDIESEIDVCSGEDDEILELDSFTRHEETVNISSSSESDIEVCDYEPAGKRMKKCQTFPASVLL